MELANNELEIKLKQLEFEKDKEINILKDKIKKKTEIIDNIKKTEMTINTLGWNIKSAPAHIKYHEKQILEKDFLKEQ